MNAAPQPPANDEPSSFRTLFQISFIVVIVALFIGLRYQERIDGTQTPAGQLLSGNGTHPHITTLNSTNLASMFKETVLDRRQIMLVAFGTPQHYFSQILMLDFAAACMNALPNNSSQQLDDTQIADLRLNNVRCFVSDVFGQLEQKADLFTPKDLPQIRMYTPQVPKEGENATLSGASSSSSSGSPTKDGDDISEYTNQLVVSYIGSIQPGKSTPEDIVQLVIVAHKDVVKQGYIVSPLHLEKTSVAFGEKPTQASTGDSSPTTPDAAIAEENQEEPSL